MRGHGKFTNQICAVLAFWPCVLGRNVHVVAFVWGEVEDLSHGRWSSQPMLKAI